MLVSDDEVTSGAYRFVPFDGNTSTVDVGRGFVLQILESRVAGLLSIASLEAEMEESTDTVLSGSR